ncbi:hypothetical protein [Vibrio algicola]|uniref:Uncharacterized protein n=1 Tax=Vibrio algicola TaxID=2662262 RepID=A0A5Q0TCC6_9VIBR|nr:hypothetical protein [Vibrio algicola]
MAGLYSAAQLRAMAKKYGSETPQQLPPLGMTLDKQEAELYSMLVLEAEREVLEVERVLFAQIAKTQTTIIKIEKFIGKKIENRYVTTLTGVIKPHPALADLSNEKKLLQSFIRQLALTDANNNTAVSRAKKGRQMAPRQQKEVKTNVINIDMKDVKFNE